MNDLIATRATEVSCPVEDDSIIRMWLHGRPDSTRAVYAPIARDFLAAVGKPLRATTLPDLQQYQTRLAGLAVATQCKKLSAIKSLLGFANKTGYLPVNIGVAVHMPKIKNTLAERILAEEDVIRMLALERDPRNKTLLRLLYLAGLRASEAPVLRGRDLQPNGDAGQITVFGKGGKTRVILLKSSLWKDLVKLRGNDPDLLVFRSSRNGRPLSRQQIWRIVKRAALRAELSELVSTHWIRHSHASHALDNGCPPHLLQATLGHASLSTTSRYAHAKPSESSSTYIRG